VASDTRLWKEALREFEDWVKWRDVATTQAESEQLLPLFLDFCNITPPILDVGCGNGDFGAATGWSQYVGIDPLIRGQRSFPRIRGVSEQLPFKSNSFATVVALASLDHLANPDEAMREIRRVMASDGALFIWQDVRRTDARFRFGRVLAYLRVKDISGLFRSLSSNMKALTGQHAEDGYGHTVHFTDASLTALVRRYFYVGRTRMIGREMFLECRAG